MLRYVVNLLLFVGVASAVKSYNNYKVLRLLPATNEATKLLRELQLEDVTLDFWKEPGLPKKPVDVMMHQSGVKHFLQKINGEEIDVDVIIDNVQKLIDEEKAHMAKKPEFTDKSSCSTFALDHYHTFDEMITYLQCMAQTYPSLTTFSSMGNSFENRQLPLLRIGAASATKGVWIDAGIHAREWITGATAMWIINHLLSTYATDPNTQNLLNNINFYIAPALNPDGFAYSHNTDRMWRKTRSGPYQSSGWFSSTCWGVDPNRNWADHWGLVGTSSNPCSETYLGPKVFSEPECNLAAKWLTNNKGSLQAYISLHSYSQDWFYPYGYAANTYSSDKAEMIRVAELGAQALTAVHGTQYTVGSAADILYASSGASDDWAKEIDGIKYTYTLELRDTGSYGFNLPANQIIATAQETWAGINVVAQAVNQLKDL